MPLRYMVGLILALGLFSWAQGAEYTGPVVTIADGDTFAMRIGTTDHRIRLCGIDSPETARSGRKRSQIIAHVFAAAT